MPGIRQRRCPEGYGVKSLRMMHKAKHQGMHLRKDGKVVLPTGKIHNATPQWGRTRINLSIDGELCSIQTARVICFLAYGDPLTPKSVVDHIDGDTLNDSIENLRWATYSENCLNREVTRNKTWEQRAIEACESIKPEMVPQMLEALKVTVDLLRQVSEIHANNIDIIIQKAEGNQ